MSEFRLCLINASNHETSQFIKFDNKEDAEHEAKNRSQIDEKHIYQVQKNHHGDFVGIKSYLKGEVIEEG